MGTWQGKRRGARLLPDLEAKEEVPGPERDRRLCEMVRWGATRAEAGRRFDLTQERVRQVLAKAGVRDLAATRRAREAVVDHGAALRAVVRELEPCTVPEACRALALAPTTMGRLVPEAGRIVEAERARRREEAMRPLWELREAGASWDEVARAGGLGTAGRARSRVVWWARSQGLPTRKVGPGRSRWRADLACRMRGESRSWEAVVEATGYGSVASAQSAVKRRKRGR